MKFLGIGLLLIFSLNAKSQNAFSYLETLKLDFNGCQVGSKGVLVHYNKSRVNVINKSTKELGADHPLLNTEKYSNEILVLKGKLNNSDQEYYLLFSDAASCDLLFEIIDSKSLKRIGKVWASEIYLPSNGSVYSEGHMNSYFNIRRKFQFTEMKLSEVEPEYYYVGLQSKTLRAVNIYTENTLTTQLATLPADYDIEVLVAKKFPNDRFDWRYLIKTKFGLVGWATIESSVMSPLDVEGIFYAGD